VFIAAGALIVNGSLEQGVGWTPTGPESGYFPFRIGWLIVAVGAVQSGIAIAMARRGQADTSRRESFLQRDRLKPLLQVFVPTLAFVPLTQWLGLYVASFALIAGFMYFIGHIKAWKSVVTGYVFSAAMFLIFEVAFFRNERVDLVAETDPLPKSARLPSLNRLIELTGFNFSKGVVLQGFLPFAVIVGVGYHLMLNRSRFGLRSQATIQSALASNADASTLRAHSTASSDIR